MPHSASSKRIYRAVAGAVRNVADCHPDWDMHHPQAARSIAKRAAGTLRAQWPEVLAATPSATPRRNANSRRRGGGGSLGHRLPPFSARLHREVSRLVRPAKDAGNTERVAALIEVLRIIADMRGGK